MASPSLRVRRGSKRPSTVGKHPELKLVKRVSAASFARSLTLSPEAAGAYVLLCLKPDSNPDSDPNPTSSPVQVCELWLRLPDIALLYVSEAVQMSLHGSDAVEDELDEMLAEGQDGAGEYANLLQSRDPELTEVATRSLFPLVVLPNLLRVEFQGFQNLKPF